MDFFKKNPASYCTRSENPKRQGVKLKDFNPQLPLRRKVGLCGTRLLNPRPGFQPCNGDLAKKKKKRRSRRR